MWVFPPNSPYKFFTSLVLYLTWDEIYMRGEISMETYSKTGLILVFVNVAILIAIVVMYPTLSIIGLMTALYLS